VWKNDKQDRYRAMAASSLGRLGPEAKAAVPALTAALQDEDDMVREHAAEALGQITGNGNRQKAP
jgi:HEAT repeat protein